MTEAEQNYAQIEQEALPSEMDGETNVNNNKI